MAYKRTRNGKTRWVAEIMQDGKRRSKLFTTKTAALKWEKQTRKEEFEDTTSMPAKEWAAEYLDYAKRYSPKVVNEKKTTFDRFLRHAGKTISIDSITPRKALLFLQSQYRERSGHAANKARKNMVAAWNWGIKYMGMPVPNPFAVVEKFPQEEQGHYVPPEKDFWATLDVAEGQEWVLLLTFLHTAGRRGEIYKLQWDDVDFANQRIRLRTRKRMGGSLESDWLPMTDELHGILLEHRQHAISEWVFPQRKRQHKGQPYKEMRRFPQRLCEKAGVKPFGCHGIRGLAASILAKHNVPMIAIAQLLRHKNLRTTERYVRGLETVRPHLRVLEGGMRQRKDNVRDLRPVYVQQG